MVNIWSSLFRKGGEKSEERLSLNDYAEQWFSYNGMQYPLGVMQRGGDTETIDNDFEAYVGNAYKADGVVFACITARQFIFSEARFQFQRMRGGRPGDLFGTKALDILETPWPRAGTSTLLSRALQDTDLAGNHYVVDEGDRLRWLRPDWVEIVLTAPPTEAVQSDVRGHIYKPGNSPDPETWEIYPIDGSNGTVAHWAPIPDPVAQYRGMSWLTPVIREILSDKAATKHKLKFFENAATPNLAVSLSDQLTAKQFREFMAAMNAEKHGVEHAYETLYLGGGADVTVIGADMKQMDFKVTQGAGETRIAAAARIHPVIVGLSEGMQGSSLNAGNFRAAKDAFADGTMRPLWRSICQAYSVLVPVPEDTRLWFDDRDIAFLREDRKELVEIQDTEATILTKLVREGWTPESVAEAMMKEDWRLLEHTGLYSVQLQPPMPEGQQSGQQQSVDPKTGKPVDPKTGKPADPKAVDKGKTKPKPASKEEEEEDQ